MKVLALGDIVGSPARNALKQELMILIEQQHVDFVIVNAENSAGGSGITPKIADELFRLGVDVITAGDHIWKKKELESVIHQYPYLLRPANFSHFVPGNGSCVKKARNGVSVGVISVMGRVFMNTIVECPFQQVVKEIEKIKEKTSIIFVDIHAEATSEKIAMGWYLDGKVTGVYGTHTHVQTSDNRLLPNGTAYITDLGMTGSIDSVLGRKSELIIRRFLTGMPVKFELATENVQFQGILVEVDETTGKATSIERFIHKAP